MPFAMEEEVLKLTQLQSDWLDHLQKKIKLQFVGIMVGTIGTCQQIIKQKV